MEEKVDVLQKVHVHAPTTKPLENELLPDKEQHRVSMASSPLQGAATTYGSNSFQEASCEGGEHVLQKAIASIECFLEQNKNASIPSLSSLHIAEDRLEATSLSSLENTLSGFLSMFSEKQRARRKIAQKPVAKTLLLSAETIKIALIRLQNEGQSPLKEKLEKISEQYNTILKSIKKKPSSFSSLIKYYFFKAAGWLIDKEIAHSVIVIPKLPPLSFKTPYTASLSPSFFTPPAHPQESDLFYAKARTLLSKHAPQTIINDVVKSLRTQPLEVTLCPESVVSLKQTVSYLPGEVYQLAGNFSRTGTRSIPISESFSLSLDALQTGYPHPMQSVGIGLADGLLPYVLVRSWQRPLLDSLINRKQVVAEKLLPQGECNTKAKELVALRKLLFTKEASSLIPELKKLLSALFEAAHMQGKEQLLFPVLDKDHGFELLSTLFHQAALKIFSIPYLKAEKLWCEGYLTTEKLFELCEKAILSSVTEERVIEELFLQVQKPIATLLFKDKLNLEQVALPLLAQKLLILSAFELERFIEEVELLPCAYEALFSWVKTLLEERRALLTNTSPHHPAIDEWLDHSS